MSMKTQPAPGSAKSAATLGPPRQLLGISAGLSIDGRDEPLAESDRLADVFGLPPQMERIYYQLDVDPLSDAPDITGWGHVTLVAGDGRVPWLSIDCVAGGDSCGNGATRVPYDDVLNGDYDPLWLAAAERLADYSAEVWFSFNHKDDRQDVMAGNGPADKSAAAAKHVRDVMTDHRNLPQVVFARILSGSAFVPPANGIDPGEFLFGSGYDVYATNGFDPWQRFGTRRPFNNPNFTGHYLQFIRDPESWYNNRPTLDIPENLEPPPYRAALAEVGSSVDVCESDYHANWLADAFTELRNNMSEIEAVCYWHNMSWEGDFRFAGGSLTYPHPSPESINAWIDSASLPQHQV